MREMKESPDEKFSSVIPKRKPNKHHKSDHSKEKIYNAEQLVTPLDIAKNEVSPRAQELLKRIRDRKNDLDPKNILKNPAGIIGPKPSTVEKMSVMPLIGKLPKKRPNDDDKKDDDRNPSDSHGIDIPLPPSRPMNTTRVNKLDGENKLRTLPPAGSFGFIGPRLPPGHPLAHTDDIPLPPQKQKKADTSVANVPLPPGQPKQETADSDKNPTTPIKNTNPADPNRQNNSTGNPHPGPNPNPNPHHPGSNPGHPPNCPPPPPPPNQPPMKRPRGNMPLMPMPPGGMPMRPPPGMMRRPGMMPVHRFPRPPLRPGPGMPMRPPPHMRGMPPMMRPGPGGPPLPRYPMPPRPPQPPQQEKPPEPEPPKEPPPPEEEKKPEPEIEAMEPPVIPPEQAELYKELQEKAQKHAKKLLKQQRKQEAGEPESSSSEEEEPEEPEPEENEPSTTPTSTLAEGQRPQVLASPLAVSPQTLPGMIQVSMPVGIPLQGVVVTQGAPLMHSALPQVGHPMMVAAGPSAAAVALANHQHQQQQQQAAMLQAALQQQALHAGATGLPHGLTASMAASHGLHLAAHHLTAHQVHHAPMLATGMPGLTTSGLPAGLQAMHHGALTPHSAAALQSMGMLGLTAGLGGAVPAGTMPTTMAGSLASFAPHTTTALTHHMLAAAHPALAGHAQTAGHTGPFLIGAPPGTILLHRIHRPPI
jgi:hypothetical protein